jgi:dolichol-phosphate mannosyltransferase
LKFSNTTVVIAALEEELGMKPTLIELRDVLKDSCFLIADGGSKDKTVEIAQNLGASTFVQKGKGKGSAIRQSLHLISSSSKYVVFTDADYTYPAFKVREMLLILDKNPNVGMVLADRFHNRWLTNLLTNPFFLGNRFIALVQWVLNGVRLSDPLTGLRVVRYKLLKDWNPLSESFDIESELNCYINKRGYRIFEVPIEYRPRLGKKKLGVMHAFTILRRITKEFTL